MKKKQPKKNPPPSNADIQMRPIKNKPLRKDGPKAKPGSFKKYQG